MKILLTNVFTLLAARVTCSAAVYWFSLPALLISVFYGIIFFTYALPLSLETPEHYQLFGTGAMLVGVMLLVVSLFMGGGKFIRLPAIFPSARKVNSFFDILQADDEIEASQLLEAVGALILFPRMNMYVSGISVLVVFLLLALFYGPSSFEPAAMKTGMAGFGVSLYMYLLFVYSISDLVTNPLRKKSFEMIIRSGMSLPDVYGFSFRKKILFLLGFLLAAVLVMLYLITYTHISFDYFLLFFAITALVIILLVLVYVFPLVNVFYHVLATTGALSRGEDAYLVVGNNEREILNFSTLFNRSLNEFIYLRKNLEVKVKERTELLEKRNRELLENEEKFRTLADSAQDAIIMMDNDGNVSYWNRAGEIIFGYSREEILGRSLHEILAPRRYEEMFQKKYADFKRFGKGLALGKTVEFSAVRKTGEEFPVEVSLSAFKLDYKWNAVAILRDITERKDYEQEIYKAKQYAESANRAKSEFLANMSHEIRTPMNGILGFSEIIKHDCREPEIREKAEIIYRSGMGLLELINDILDLSKIEAGRMEVAQENFDFYELIKQTHLLHSIVAEKKGLDFNLIIDESLPRFIVSDAKKLQQIITNLLSNAVKFTDKGFVNFSAETVSWYGNEVIAKITVEDSGIGIPTDELELIFKSFEQSDASTTRNYEGTGLGLAITKSFVEMLKGHIWAESEPGQGARFCFIIKAEEGTEEGVLPSLFDNSLEPDFAALKFMIITDDENSRMLLEYMLSKGALSVEIVQNNFLSLDDLLEKEIDCLFLDPLATDKEGGRLVPLLREKTGDALKLVAFGPLLPFQGGEEVDSRLFDGVIEKPLSRKALFRILFELFPETGNGSNGVKPAGALEAESFPGPFVLDDAVKQLMRLSLDRSGDRKKALELTGQMILETAGDIPVIGEIRDAVNNFEYDLAETLILRLGDLVQKRENPGS